VTSSSSSRPPGPEDRLHIVLSTYFKNMNRIGSREHRQVMIPDMACNKAETTAKAAFSEQLQETFWVQMLATSPKRQGKGYGPLLLAALTDKAEAEQRTTWLRSSDASNMEYYERCGFTTIAEFRAGESNPTWLKPPVVVHFPGR